MDWQLAPNPYLNLANNPQQATQANIFFKRLSIILTKHNLFYFIEPRHSIFALLRKTKGVMKLAISLFGVSGVEINQAV